MRNLTLRQLQFEVALWVNHNFPEQTGEQALLGVGEEVGELNHAHLKRIQGIRGDAAKHHAEAQDAVGDIVIFLAGYCKHEGYDFQDAVRDAWARAKARDWRADPERGGEG